MIQWRTRKIAQLVKLGIIVINAPTIEQRKFLISLGMETACIKDGVGYCYNCFKELKEKKISCYSLYGYGRFPDGKERRIISFKQFQNWALKPNKK